MSEPAPSIGIVTGSVSRNAGGLFNSVRKSAIHLRSAGATVAVYGLEDEFSAADGMEWLPVEPHVLSAKHIGPLRFAPGLMRALDEGRHDVVHLHGIWELHSRTVGAWKRLNGGKVMISPRGMLDPWALRNSALKKKLVGAWYENRNLREADCLHALNTSEAQAMRDYGLTNPIAIIPNATDLPDIGPRAPQPGRKTMLFLGRIHPKKGLRELIQGWAAAANENGNFGDRWNLVIAGWDDGGHLPALEEAVARLGMTECIRFAGPAYGEDKDRLLRGADAFILPSHSEGLPMSVLEAWAYRLPVLMTDSCNLPEGFAAGAAIRIEPAPASIAAALIEAAGDPELARMGECGRDLVAGSFGWENVAARHLEVYRWMIGGGAVPACVQLAAD